MSDTSEVGPWQIKEDGFGYPSIYGTDEDGNPGDLVAHTFVGHEHLIRSAPEMLEALRLCVPTGVSLTNPNIRDRHIVPLEVPMGDLRKIAAAIAKAPGATP